MRCFVTGGSGFVGRHLILRLLADGHTVRALARSDRSAQVVESLGATAVRADLLAAESVADQLRGCGVTVHAAADTRPGGRAEDLERTNVAGTRSVLAASRAAGVRRFVHVSTAAVVADGRPLRWADESAPYPARHAGHLARTQALAEQLVLVADDRSMRTTAVRPRLVWGPGDTAVLPWVLDAAAAGRWAWVDGGDYPTSTCHVRNLCEGITCAAERGRGGRPYFLTDGAPVRFRDFLTRLAAAHGAALPDRSVPLRAVRTAAAVTAWRVVPRRGEPPVSRTVAALGAQEMTVDDARARTEIGYTPVVTVEEGLAELAEAPSAGGA